MSHFFAQDDSEDFMTRLTGGASGSRSVSQSTSTLQSSRKRMNWEQVLSDQPDDAETADSQEHKRRRLDEEGAEAVKKDEVEDVHHEANLEIGERCIICLMTLRDRTLVGPCKHSGFCFECIGVWSEQSRKCPLCTTPMAPFLLHDLDREMPTKFFLPPLPEPRSLPSSSSASSSSNQLHVRPFRSVDDHPGRKTEPRTQAEIDELTIQVSRRKEIYQYGLYAKHVASNPLTQYRPNLTPRQFVTDVNLVKRATMFLRRELRVWRTDNVEYLTTYIVSLLKAIDIRSEPAIRLLANLFDTGNDEAAALDIDRGAEHFAHELYSFMRSPFIDLATYDDVTQYDSIESALAARKAASRTLSSEHDEDRGRPASRSRSPVQSPSRSRSRSYPSRSPSRSRSPPPRVRPPRIGGRRWDERDSWVDPEWLAEQEERNRPRPRPRQPCVWGDGLGVGDARLPARRLSGVPSQARAQGEAAGMELLPDGKTQHSELRQPALYDRRAAKPSPQQEPAAPTLSIRGKATASRQSLLDRLDQAKAVSGSGSMPTPASPIVESKPAVIAVRGADRDEKLRLQEKLRAKLMLAKANVITPDAKARELREKLLARKKSMSSDVRPVVSEDA